eukprot:14267666-Heterocapsa_arctica.AAC.1
MLLPPSEYTQNEQYDAPGGLAPLWRCWDDGAAPCGHRFCVVCGDPTFRQATRPSPDAAIRDARSTVEHVW